MIISGINYYSSEQMHHQEETNQATDQQLASMEEISHSADTLARLADGLRDEVEQFKL